MPSDCIWGTQSFLHPAMAAALVFPPMHLYIDLRFSLFCYCKTSWDTVPAVMWPYVSWATEWSFKCGSSMNHPSLSLKWKPRQWGVHGGQGCSFSHILAFCLNFNLRDQDEDLGLRWISLTIFPIWAHWINLFFPDFDYLIDLLKGQSWLGQMVRAQSSTTGWVRL